MSQAGKLLYAPSGLIPLTPQWLCTMNCSDNSQALFHTCIHHNSKTCASCHLMRQGGIVLTSQQHSMLFSSVLQEEDFITHTFGLPIHGSPASKDEKVPKTKPSAAVSLAEDQLLAARQQSNQHAGSPNASDEDDATSAVLARLRFAKSFLRVSVMQIHHRWQCLQLCETWRHLMQCCVFFCT